ncbi:MAG: ABC-2 type transport system permease protein [Neolewinella sp.]
MVALLLPTLISPPMNKLFLWLVGLLNPLWRQVGADPKAINLILAAKLKMDDRGGFAMGKRQKQQKGMEYFTYFFVGLFGVMLMFLFRVCDDPATAVGLGFCAWVCYIGLMLITEMSENLFDERDLYVLLSRPINDYTLSISRILHITVFASKFGLSLGGASFIYLGFFVGIWPAIAYFLVSILAIVITMTGTLVFYLVLLQRVKPERLKKSIGYFQIVAALLFFTAYQLPSLLGGFIDLEGLELVDTAVGFSFPGLWLGGLFKAMTSTSVGWMAYAQGALALLAAGFGGWFYLQQSAGYADRLLALKHAGSIDAGAARISNNSKGHSPVRDRLAAWFTLPNQERVSFKFHWNVMVRDMTFKQRTYPTLVYLPVILVITVFRDAITGEEAFSVGSGTMLMILYFLMWVVVIPLGQTKVSEDYRAAWIFEATPNAHKSRIMYGQLLAVIGMFFLPMAVLVYTTVLAFEGFAFLPDIALACGATLLFSLIYNQVDKAHPFSRAKDDSKFQNFAPFLMISLLGGLLGFGHWALRGLPYIIPVAAVVVWGILIGWVVYLRRK